MRDTPNGDKPVVAGAAGAPVGQPGGSDGGGRTLWLGRDTALRRFLRAETGSGVALVTAAVAALVWANSDAGSYNQVWSTPLSIQVGHWGVSMDMREWINSGLMTFFFLVVGLEARREFDIGEFRERARIVLPVLAGLGGMLGAVGVYVAVNAGRLPSRRILRWCGQWRLPSKLGWRLDEQDRSPNRLGASSRWPPGAGRSPDLRSGSPSVGASQNVRAER